jgi:phosphoenolpyruvate carboxykinase (ATP)
MVRGQKITVRDSVKIIEMIARDKITWRRDDFWGYEVPLDIPGVELDRFDPKNYYSDEQIERISNDFKRERLTWLAQFPSLDKDILTAIKSET